jgi:hypothetical protein
MAIEGKVVSLLPSATYRPQATAATKGCAPGYRKFMPEMVNRADGGIGISEHRRVELGVRIRSRTAICAAALTPGDEQLRRSSDEFTRAANLSRRGRGD